MPIIHIQTESVEALSRQMANLSDDLYERSQQMVHSLNAADWDGPNKERFLAELRAWQRQSQELAERMNALAAQVRREMEQWLEAAASLEPGQAANNRWGFASINPDIWQGIRDWLLIMISCRLSFRVVGDQTIAGEVASPYTNFWQLSLLDKTYTELIAERSQLLNRIAENQRQLASLPALQDLMDQLSANETKQATLKDQMAALDEDIAKLQKDLQNDDAEAKKWFNQVLPSEQGGWDSVDGVPWRVRADDFEDQRDQVKAEIERLRQQRADLEEALARLETDHDLLSVNQKRVQSLQDDLKYKEGNLVYLNQLIDEKAPKTIPQEVLDKIPYAYEVPLENQLSIKYKGAVGSHACTPTSISMITEYYHSVDASNKGLSPLDLIQMQEPDAESYSMRSGSNANWFFDDLKEAGYTISYNQNMNTIGNLQEQLTGGPVLALIKQSSGANHAVVVTGAQNGYVSIADPWQGVNRTYTEQQFSKMWKGLDDGWLVSIRPEAKAAAL